MTVTNTGAWAGAGSADRTWTTNGVSLATIASLDTGSGAYNGFLGSNLDIGTKTFTLRKTGGWVFGTNGYTITAGTISITNVSQVITLGASVINCTAWNWVGATPTLNANTSSIRVTGTGTFTGAGKTYYDVQLNGTAHTVTGNNTYTSLQFNPAGAQTLTFTGTTQTFASMSRAGNGVITIVNGSFTKTGAGTVVRLRKISISGNTASPTFTFYAIDSVDGGSNVAWHFERSGSIIPRLMAAGVV